LNQPEDQPQLRTCAGCGNPTPAEQAECVHCGFRSLASAAAERERQRTITFIDSLFTRGHPFTFILIGINVAMFLLTWTAGGMTLFSADIDVLIGLGAKENLLIDQQQQYWRLITCMFLHSGFAHLILNNYALWVLGQQIEQIYGSARYVLLYIAAGLVASLASYFFNSKHPSVGASGAIFGLFGVMATFAFRYRREIPQAIRRDIIRRIVPIIAINLLFGFSISIVDNSAHVGGLIAGALLALLIPYKRPGESKTAVIWRVLQIACVALVFASFVEAFRTYDGPRPDLKNLTSNPEARLRTIDAAAEGLIESINLFTAVLQTRDERADLTPAISAAERGLLSLERLRTSDRESDTLRVRLLELLSEQKRIVSRFAQSSPRNWNAARAEEDALIKRGIELNIIKDSGGTQAN
jgi:membrane associated rhomboid family serine protease